MSGGMLSIGELARATGVKPTTIRWYETEGLLPPPARTEGGHRAYGRDHLKRLGFIRHARADRPGADCTAVHTIAMAQVGEIDSRLRQLEALRAELVRMAEHCRGGTAGDCRVIETLADFTHGHCQESRHPGDG